MAAPAGRTEFVEALAALRRRCGNPMLRIVAARSGIDISVSTISNTLRGKTRPSWGTAAGIITGLGGDPETLRALYERSYPDGVRERLPRPGTEEGAQFLALLGQVVAELRGLRADLRADRDRTT